MSNQYDIANDLKAAIDSNATVQAWANTEFGKNATVLLSNRPIVGKDAVRIMPEQYPFVVIAFIPGGDDVQEGYIGEPFYLTEHYGMGFGIVNEDPVQALRQTSEFETLLINAIRSDKTRNGMADSTTPISTTPDGDIFHPKYTREVTLQVSRSAPY